MSFDDELVASFVTETIEHLADVEHKLLEIEAEGHNSDPEMINTVFRAVHSTKGTAGFMGLHTINSLAHEMENLLNLVRSNHVQPTTKVTDVLLRSTDRLRSLVNHLETSEEEDVSELIAELAALITEDSAKNSLHHEAVSLTQSTDEVLQAEQFPSEEESGSDSSAVAAENEAGSSPVFTSSPAMKPSALNPSSPKANTSDNNSSTGTVAAESSIRVPVGILDRLMNLAGELVLGRNQLLQVIECGDQTSLESVGARVDQVTSELQEAIMHSRMQPIGNIFGRFTRVVRDLSQQLNKQCDLIVEGKEVELDKTIIEAIGDPLIHLIRNSLDHGVETPEQRMAKGKKPTGQIRLTASHQAGRVNITISDDGAGIQAAKLRSSAISKGVITADQAAAMNDRDAVRLVFHPGFSTAERVTDISGRGVGMDVVKTNIAKLGGTVDIETEWGKGTTVRVKLPLTLAIIPSLVIRCGGERFAIPQGSINELVRVPAQEVAKRVERVKESELLRLRGKLLPLVRLSEALWADQKESPYSVDDENSSIVPEVKTCASMNIIVVEAGLLRYGLIVDGLNDSEEIVVKPLGEHLKDCPCLAGATVLGDGHVALILDITSIASHMRLSKTSEAELETHLSSEARYESETQKMLLFSNHPSEHFAIPMSVIKRIERFSASQMESIGEHDFIQYRNTSLPLLSLERHIQAQPRPVKDRWYAVVFESGGREVGLIVPTLVDIREVHTDIDSQTFREPGVLGSLVLEKRALRLIDVYELTAIAHPEWARDTSTGSPSRAEQSTILLAEDSGFFRRQVANFLESHGHTVVTCEDGALAWDTLQGGQQEFHLVVTDIEMPNMTGFELCERIRSHSDFKRMPVIALTSLADEESKARGVESGVSDYQVKMDRDRLLSAVNRLLSEKSMRQETREPSLAV